ncbi:hypothetical protein HKD37_02G005065 [Glycine soja]
MKYTMNSVIIVLYFNERVYEDNDCVTFEGSKKAIQIKSEISFNALKKKIGDKDVTGGSMFHSANSLTSCGNNLSNNETQPPTNVSNLHGDEDDDDDLVSNSYVEESLDEYDSVDGISDTDDEVTDMIQPGTLLASTFFFYQNLEKFRQLSLAIETWIDRISKDKWTMAYDREGRRYDHMTTNLSECINKVLKDCRNIPR